MINIVFLDSTGLPKNYPIPRPNFEHQWTEYDNTTDEQVLERAINADIVITSKIEFRRELLQQLPKLKLIALTATGTNNIDLVAARELGITVKNVAGYSAVAVPEHVLGLIFTLKHNLHLWYRDQLQGKWAESEQFCYFDYPISDIRGATLGVIGKGSLGAEVGRLASLLGMKVLFAEHRNAKTCRAGYTPFNDVLAQSDIVTLHCPLTAETENLINSETLSHFKQGAILINTGRGALVDENALLNALENGKLGGAALDVLAKEPPEADNPLILAAQRLPNLIITPHIAWTSDAALQTLVGKVRLNLEEFFNTGK